MSQSHVIRDVVLADVDHGVRVVGDRALALVDFRRRSAARPPRGARGPPPDRRRASIWCSASYASAASHRVWFFFTIGSTSRRTSIRSWTVAKITLRYVCFSPTGGSSDPGLPCSTSPRADLALVPRGEETPRRRARSRAFVGEEKVRRVPHLRLERLAVLLHEVAVHGAELLAGLGLLNGGLDRVDGEGFGP